MAAAVSYHMAGSDGAPVALSVQQREVLDTVAKMIDKDQAMMMLDKSYNTGDRSCDCTACEAAKAADDAASAAKAAQVTAAAAAAAAGGAAATPAQFDAIPKMKQQNQSAMRGHFHEIPYGGLEECHVTRIYCNSKHPGEDIHVIEKRKQTMLAHTSSDDDDDSGDADVAAELDQRKRQRFTAPSKEIPGYMKPLFQRATQIEGWAMMHNSEGVGTGDGNAGSNFYAGIKMNGFLWQKKASSPGSQEAQPVFCGFKNSKGEAANILTTPHTEVPAGFDFQHCMKAEHKKLMTQALAVVNGGAKKQANLLLGHHIDVPMLAFVAKINDGQNVFHPKLVASGLSDNARKNGNIIRIFARALGRSLSSMIKGSKGSITAASERITNPRPLAKSSRTRLPGVATPASAFIIWCVEW